MSTNNFSFISFTYFFLSFLLLACHCFHSFHFSILSTFFPLNSSPYFFPSFINFFAFLFCLTLFPLILSLLSVLPNSSALRSCSTGDSLLSSAFIRSAKSAPALAPPLPVLLHHHHHPLLPPLADQLAGTHSLHYLSACLPLWRLVCTSVRD